MFKGIIICRLTTNFNAGKQMRLFFLFYFMTSIPLFGASISGTIKSAYNNRPLSGAYVNVIKLNKFNKTSGTGLYGQYDIYNLPTGKYSVTVYKYGYLLNKDTLYITRDDEEIKYDVKLKVDATTGNDAPEVKKYHDYFSRFKPEEILEIHLDSIVTRKFMLKERVAYEISIHNTFTNKTDSVIYILENFLCRQKVKLLVRNSKGEMMKDYTVIPDCMERDVPDSGEFIRIPPHTSINYPRKNFRVDNFIYYPKGIYTVGLQYKYSEKDRLYGNEHPDWDYKNTLEERLYYYNIALRGKFMSVNELKFDNSQVCLK